MGIWKEIKNTSDFIASRLDAAREAEAGTNRALAAIDARIAEAKARVERGKKSQSRTARRRK